MRKETIETQKYVAPEVRVMEVEASTLICTSNENVGEENGTW